MSEPTRHAEDDDDPTQPDRAPSNRGPDSFHANVPDLRGKFVGKYEIMDAIDAGGMGMVYRAMQEQPRRVVALKLMRVGFGSRMALHRFETEAQTLARLHHSNIAQIYEAGMHTDGTMSVPYFAMEYVAGARAIDAYANAKQLGVRERLELFATACDAVEHAHTRGIIHRDIKPQNVLVGADGVLKVIDFGVARATDSDLAAPTLQTHAGAVIGTPLYCSPEQFDGDSSALDERTDVYSLGMVLYELLVARLPYTFSSQALPEVSRVITTEEPLRPSKVKRELGRDVDAVILTALQKDRSRRYPTAAALAADVQCLISGDPISRFAARSASLRFFSRLRQLATRHPAGIAMLVMIVSWAVSYLLALPLLYATRIDGWIESRLVSLVPYGDPNKPLQSVKVITINDDTDLAAISARENLVGISEKNLQSQRRLFGRLLERLADTNVRMVVFDMYFRVPSDFDADFVTGIRKFKARGGEVIIGTRDWWIGADDSKLISPVIKPEVVVGCIDASIQGNAPWALELFVEHQNADAIPGLALAAFGRFRSPGAAMSFSPREYGESVEIRYRRPTTQSVVPSVAGVSDVVEASTMRAERSDSATAGLEKGDIMGRFVVPLPSSAALIRSTLEIGQVLSASPQEMTRLIDRPVVLIASNRTGVDGPFDYVDGRKIRGFYAQAAGLDMLLRRDSIREPRRFHDWTVIWLGVVAGVGIARMRLIRWQLITLASFALFTALVAVVAYRLSWLADPLTCAVPMLIGYALMQITWRRTQMLR